MSTVAIPPTIQRLIGRYARAFLPERIVLFGSHAKGKNHPGSDVDLLIVSRPAHSDTRAGLRRARQLAADCFPPVDIVFATPEEVEQAATAPSPFLQSILQSGITVYEKPSRR